MSCTPPSCISRRTETRSTQHQKVEEKTLGDPCAPPWGSRMVKDVNRIKAETLSSFLLDHFLSPYPLPSPPFYTTLSFRPPPLPLPFPRSPPPLPLPLLLSLPPLLFPPPVPLLFLPLPFLSLLSSSPFLSLSSLSPLLPLSTSLFFSCFFFSLSSSPFLSLPFLSLSSSSKDVNTPPLYPSFRPPIHPFLTPQPSTHSSATNL
jgi:hypothetical protein